MSSPLRREPSPPEPTHYPRTPPEGGVGGCLPRGSGAPTPPRANLALPPSLAALLAEFRSCFSSRTFPVFCALAAGLLAQTARRTVCGMLVGAGLSRVWSHHRAHRFFSHASWSLDQVCATLTQLVVRLLLPEGQPVSVAVDDTLFHRRGPKVHAASWFHDGSAQGAKKVGYGNNWVIAAIVVRLPFLDRPVAVPVGFALVRKGTDDASRLRCYLSQGVDHGLLMRDRADRPEGLLAVPRIDHRHAQLEHEDRHGDCEDPVAQRGHALKTPSGDKVVLLSHTTHRCRDGPQSSRHPERAHGAIPYWSRSA